MGLQCYPRQVSCFLQDNAVFFILPVRCFCREGILVSKGILFHRENVFCFCLTLGFTVATREKILVLAVMGFPLLLAVCVCACVCVYVYLRVHAHACVLFSCISLALLSCALEPTPVLLFRFLEYTISFFLSSCSLIIDLSTLNVSFPWFHGQNQGGQRNRTRKRKT